MNTTPTTGSIRRYLAYAAGLTAASYAAFAGYTWLSYGHPSIAVKREEEDAVLDRFMPTYDVVERHNVRVAAPAEMAFHTACAMDLQRSRVIRAVFKARDCIMHSQSGTNPEAHGFLSQMKAIGWGVLAEIPGREVIMGAVTQPWLPNPVFRPLLPGDFAAFNDPDYVKIVWTLRADPISAQESVFRTETRALATDHTARSKFRLYWSFVAPGVRLIRWMSGRLVKAAVHGARLH